MNQQEEINREFDYLGRRFKAFVLDDEDFDDEAGAIPFLLDALDALEAEQDALDAKGGK